LTHWVRLVGVKFVHTGPVYVGTNGIGTKGRLAAIAAGRVSVSARSREDEPTLTQDYFGHV